jgi:hypothetical protein
MIVKVKYSNKTERKQIMQQKEIDGYRMLEDNFDSTWVAGQEPFGEMVFTNEPEAPPIMDSRTHWAEIKQFNIGQEKPLQGERTFNHIKYTFDCYVTQALINEYQAGQLQVGDYIIVEFIEGKINRPLAIAKVYKSW